MTLPTIANTKFPSFYLTDSRRWWCFHTCNDYIRDHVMALLVARVSAQSVLHSAVKFSLASDHLISSSNEIDAPEGSDQYFDHV